MKFCPPDATEAKSWMRKNWEFQTSWFILRFIVIFATAAMVMASAANSKLKSRPSPPEVSQPTEHFGIADEDNDINIPGEPNVDHADDELTLEEQRESARDFQAQITGDRAWLKWSGRNFPQEATFVLRLMTAFVVAICMWMTSMLISLVNLARVAGGKPGFYPLILPWLKKKKAS